MLKRVNDDRAAAEKFMRAFHDECKDRYTMYYSARNYEDLKTKNRFPDPFFQDQIDKFVSWNMEKLFYKGKPCTVTGVEEEDKEDAEAKQAMIAWQDYKDDVEHKTELMLRDCAMYRLCVGQIDYVEIRKRRVVGVEQPVLDEMGQPMLDEMGQPVLVSKAVPQEIVTYKGPSVKRVDPLDLFITQEKSEVDDEHPIMLRSRRSMAYFKSKPYFRNQDRLKDLAANKDLTGTEMPDNTYSKRMFRGYGVEKSSKAEQLEYI